MDLNIIPLEERIVMDASCGMLEGSDSLYADSSYEEDREGFGYEVDETAENTEEIIGEAADSILASYSLASSFDPEVKQTSSSDWIEKDNSEKIVISDMADSAAYDKSSEWVKADNLLNDEERIDLLTRGI